MKFIDGVGPRSEPAIYGGELVESCAWPSAVRVNSCSGVLIAPELVLTAGHCIDAEAPGAYVSFGDNHLQAQRTVTADCQIHPDYVDGGTATDLAYCTLHEAVSDVPLVPLAAGCELSAVQVAQKVELVGFGSADDAQGPGPKRRVSTEITAIYDGALAIGGDGRDTCFGDSGGPVFLPLADGTWRVIALTSRGETCGEGGDYLAVGPHIPWLESETGLDLTPCYDLEGHWDPSEACGELPLSPQRASGHWAQGCSEGPTAPQSEVCEGAPLDELPEAPGPHASCSIEAGGAGAGVMLAILLLSRLHRRISSH